MQLCVRTDACGNDIDRLIQFCNGLGVSQVHAFPQLAKISDEKGPLQPDRLRDYHTRLRQGGLSLRMLTEVIADADLASAEAQGNKIAQIGGLLRAMQAAEVESLFLFIALSGGGSEGEREVQWARLERFYREIVAQAEATGRRLAAHGHQRRDCLVFSAADMERLLTAAPSPNSGLTFCAGCLHLAGDDLGGSLRRFGLEKIFVVHARDVRRRPEGGHEDTLFGAGEIDLPAFIGHLQAMDYRGLLCPEHLPRLPYDTFEEISTACGLGYLRALMAE